MNTTLASRWAFAVVLSGVFASSTPALAANSCHRPKGASLVIASQQAVVYSKLVPDRQAPHVREITRRVYWGCVRPLGRLRRIDQTYPFDVYRWTKDHQFRLGGRFATWVKFDADHYGGIEASIGVADLGSDHAPVLVHTGYGQVGYTGGQPSQLDISALRVSTTGAVAWLQRAPDDTGAVRDQLLTVTAHHTLQLDVGAPGDLTRPHLIENALTWLHRGVVRSATITSAWT